LTLPTHLKLVPVALVSPSQISTLHLCSLRFGFESLRGAFDEVVSNPAAILGTVSHAVLEKAGRTYPPSKSPSEARQVADQAWNEALERQVERLRQRPRDGHLLRPERWPNYFLQRARAVRAAVELSMARAGFFRPREGEMRGHSNTELRLESLELRLRGRIDRIERTEHGPIVVDWKTGGSPDRESRSGDENRYRDQMLLYGALYGATFGEWPTAARVLTPAGGVQEIPLTRESCLLAAEKAGVLLDRYNSAVESMSPEELANPSPDACRYCNHRAFCDSYWHSRPDLGITDVEGKLVQVVAEPTRREWMVRISAHGGDLDGADVELVSLNPDQFFYVTQLELGANVRAVGFSRAPLGRRLFPTLRAHIVRTS
jgi:RecB family exonuclease